MRIEVNKDLLQQMVERLVREVDPDKVVLFGSRARADHRPDSDVDLLIIKDLQEPRAAAVRRAFRALSGIDVPKDIVWYTPEEVSEWSGVKNFITTRALREGRVLYEKAH